MKNKILLFTTLILAFTYTDVFSQETVQNRYYRCKTFWKQGMVVLQTAMGDCICRCLQTGDLSAMYWNPASLGLS